MTIFSLFNVLAVIYAVIAVQVVRRLRTAGRATWDDDVTPADRRLIAEVAFFLLTPPAIALHELGHAAATWALDGRIVSFWFAFYWGAVLPARIPPFSPAEGGVISAAGPVVTIVLGFAAIALVLLRPGRPARNLLLVRFGELQLGFGLLFYPLISLPTGFGDYHSLRLELNAAAPGAGNTAIAGLVLLTVAVLWYRARPAWRRRMLELTTGDAAELTAAEARLAQDPDDLEALRTAANVHLAAEDPLGALPHLERLVAARPRDPFIRYTLAVAKHHDRRRRGEALADLDEARALAEALAQAGGDTAGLQEDIERALRALRSPGSAG